MKVFNNLSYYDYSRSLPRGKRDIILKYLQVFFLLIDCFGFSCLLQVISAACEFLYPDDKDTS